MWLILFSLLVCGLYWIAPWILAVGAGILICGVLGGKQLVCDFGVVLVWLVFRLRVFGGLGLLFVVRFAV